MDAIVKVVTSALLGHPACENSWPTTRPCALSQIPAATLAKSAKPPAPPMKTAVQLFALRVADASGSPMQVLGSAILSSKKETLTVGFWFRFERKVAVTAIPGSAEHMPAESATLLCGSVLHDESRKVSMTARAIGQKMEVAVPVAVAVADAVADAEGDTEAAADADGELVLAADIEAEAEGSALSVAEGVGTDSGWPNSTSGALGPTATNLATTW